MIPLIRFKRCSPEERGHQVKWFYSHPAIAPKPMTQYQDGFSYEYVEGECPVRPERVPALIQFCERELWFPSHFRLGTNPATYADYCGNVAQSLRLSGLKDWFFSKMNRLTFTPVASCHGDLTLENVVCQELEHCLHPVPRFVFLDPGHDRGLPCRELDEAKCLQSLEETFDSKGHWPNSDTTHWYAVMMKSLSHRVLLASHYLRLLRHAQKHPEWRVSHARRRLEELTR